MTKLIKSTLAYFAKRTHDLQTQLLLASMYGLVSLFGVSGTVAILMKARKLNQPTKKAVKRVIP